MKPQGGHGKPIVFQVPQPVLGHRVYLLRGLMLLGASAGAAIALWLAIRPAAAWFALIPAGAAAGMLLFYAIENRRSAR